jgi:hypothetical protein
MTTRRYGHCKPEARLPIERFLAAFTLITLATDSSRHSVPRRAVPAAVQRRRCAAKGVALTAQIPNLRQRRLLGRMRFKCWPSPEMRRIRNPSPSIQQKPAPSMDDYAPTNRPQLLPLAG